MAENKTTEKTPLVKTSKDDSRRLTLKMLLFVIVTIVTSLVGFASRFEPPEMQSCAMYLRSVLGRVLQTRLRSVLLAMLCFGASCSKQPLRADEYLEKQIPISKAGLLANIGPNGAKSSGAKAGDLHFRDTSFKGLDACLKAGVVIASPSTHDPDYLYTWTRDAALVLKTLIQECTSGKNTSLRDTIDNYVTSQAILQQVTNPSGTVVTGGLAEPKFHIDLTAFTDSWGRPQRDGPALRATALTQYANWLIDHGNVSYVSDRVWPVIKLDLDYCAANWNRTGFDLWEEVSSSSFFTTAVQLRALKEGASLATKLSQPTSATLYGDQIPSVYCFLQSYWNPADKYVTSNTGGGRSGKDANSILASIHNFDASVRCDAMTFQPCSDKALANHKAYVDAFRSIYTINHGTALNAAVATGRYPEDVYYNGNPWYLTTLAAAEQLYDALIVWKEAGGLNVTSISLPFFQQFLPSVSIGTYRSSTPTYNNLTPAIRDYADGFLVVAAKYTPANGALAEQYHRDTGVQLSAKDLTWSYAALLTANAAREGFVQDSWGANELTLPDTCLEDSGVTVTATFNVDAETIFGENIYIVGSLDALANWSPDGALLLSAVNYPVWGVTLNLPANTQFEYKYIRKINGNVTWETDPNRLSTTPAFGSYTIDDVWR